MSFANIFSQTVTYVLIRKAFFFLPQQEFLILCSLNYLFVLFMGCALDIVSKKASPHWKSSCFSPILSSRVYSFTLAFMSVIHFELAFVGGLCVDSCFEWTWINTQLFQHHLLERLSLLPCIAFAPLSKLSQLYLWSCISGLSILSHWFIPHFHQCHTLFVTVVFIISL